jgi:hypothetical protein
MKMIVPPSYFGALAPPGSGTFSDLSVELSASRLDRQRALELHSDVYRRKGLLDEDRLKPQVLPQACAPGSAIFVAKAHDVVVGTISLYMDSVIGLPMDDVHGKEVDAMRGRFSRVVEVGGLAVLEGRRGVGIVTMLYQATFRWALATSAGCIVACVNPSSLRVYSKLLLFEVLGGCKPHPRFLGAPSTPIGLDLAAARKRCGQEDNGGPDSHSHEFFCDIDQAHTYDDLDPAQYLQWSEDEMSEMIKAKQVALVGDDESYIERLYSTNGMLRSSGGQGECQVVAGNTSL